MNPANHRNAKKCSEGDDRGVENPTIKSRNPPNLRSLTFAPVHLHTLILYRATLK
jgi:hypothetical protein